MAQLSNEPPKGRPEPGSILVVIHDFSARSADELSLSKGDRIQLIENDQMFEDGWYLGRQLLKEGDMGESGLFPEVYTKVASGPPSYPAEETTAPPYTETSTGPAAAAAASLQVPLINLPVSSFSVAELDASETIGAPLTSSTITTPLDSPYILELGGSQSKSSTSGRPQSAATNASVGSAAGSFAQEQDSTVMHETLSVIEEHITDMNSPNNNMGERLAVNDSGSEYSSNNLDHRLSYINGEETDEEEEEEGRHSLEEVAAWTPDQVAEHLFTAGVEKRHCEVFRDQEISGEVLMGMDQTSLFLKEFELGSVGRRLKTWQKIKTIQEVAREEGSGQRNTSTYGSEASVHGPTRQGSRSTASSMLPKTLSMSGRPGSRHQQSPSLSQQNGFQRIATPTSPVSPMTHHVIESRPSAASIRDLHHSRQDSVNELGSLMGSPLVSVPTTDSSLASSQGASHKKQPSFDRNWTMGIAASLSAAKDVGSDGVVAQPHNDLGLSPNLDSLDRGYFSGNEAENHSRNVLRKRAGTTHSRNSSYTDEQRQRSATAHSRHSRFGSVDSIRDSQPTASQRYHGLTNGRKRAPSTGSISMRPAVPDKDSSPIVTKLEGSPYESHPAPRPPQSASLRSPQPSDWLPFKSNASSNRHFGLRALSDAVTGSDKSRNAQLAEAISSPRKESPLQSPSRTTSSTASGGPASFEIDPDTKFAPSLMAAPGTPSSKHAGPIKKTKKETSAYTRGLEKKTPREQMIGADYSGWMKKKSSNLMTTWKPRLFVLKGRRLSYYYSEDDEQEKGLIDISFHGVVAANNDRITGLHAALTGATNSPTSPAGSHTPTIAAAEAAAEPESTLSKASTDQMFIFKLVPPKAGLARGIHFTKPTVHYFAVPNLTQGRLWMAALVKATIEKDDSQPVVTTYQQRTISLTKAQEMRHRPPALMNLEEQPDEDTQKTSASDNTGLNIQGVAFDRELHEDDSGVSGLGGTTLQHEGNNGPSSLSDSPATTPSTA